MSLVALVGAWSTGGECFFFFFFGKDTIHVTSREVHQKLAGWGFSFGEVVARSCTLLRWFDGGVRIFHPWFLDGSWLFFLGFACVFCQRAEGFLEG